MSADKNTGNLIRLKEFIQKRLDKIGYENENSLEITFPNFDFSIFAKH